MVAVNEALGKMLTLYLRKDQTQRGMCSWFENNVLASKSIESE